jgi:hypothetical protein
MSMRSRGLVERRPSPMLGVASVLLALLYCAPSDGRAQELPVATGSPDITVVQPSSVSPGGAFLRAILVPGWGHASIGSYNRGSFYFAAQAASMYTLLRTRSRISEAQSRVGFREDFLRQQMVANGETDLEVIESTLGADADLTAVRALLDARLEQREDLVALSLFLVFISGADAYVSAHLARFPDPLEIDASPAPGGGMEVALRFRLPN